MSFGHIFAYILLNVITMKKELFKLAWSIFKTNKVSFGAALRQAWATVKKVTKVTNTTWNGKVTTAYKLVVDKFNETNSSIVVLLSSFINRKEYLMTGAANYYDGGRTLNMD